MSIAENIKEMRQRKNLTQEELAEATGYSRSMIARVECGLLIPNVLMAKELSNKLGCTLDELLEN